MRRAGIFGIVLCLSLLPASSALAQDNANWWEGFHPPGVKRSTYNGKVNVIVHRDGDVYIAGHFDRVGLVDANNIARWDGRRWHPLGEGVNGEITEIYVAQTALFVAGSFSEAGGEAAPSVAQWTDGQWHRMGSGDFNGHVYAFEYHEASLYAGGRFTSNGGDSMRHLARWTGAEWVQAETHGPACNDCYPSQILSLEHYNGKLWVGGTFDRINTGTIYNLATWDDDSGYEIVGSGPGVGPHSGYNCEVAAFEQQTASLFFGGDFLEVEGDDTRGLGYASSTASLYAIPALEPENYSIHDLAEYNDALLVVADKWLRTRSAGIWGGEIGSVRTAFTAHQAPDGLYVGGSLIGATGHTDAVARWDGDEWLRVGAGLTYRNDMGDRPYTVTSFDGDLFIGGEEIGMRSVSYEVADCNGTVLYDGDDIVPLRPCLGPTHSSLVYQGRLHVGGEFSKDLGGGTYATGIARLGDESWETLGTGVTYSASSRDVNDLTEWQGLLVLGGYFEDADGLACDNLVAWDGADFQLIDDVVFNGRVEALAVFGGDLIVGGGFSTLNGEPAGRIVRWDGESWDDMNGGFDSKVMALAVWEGELYAAGDFAEANGVAVSSIARWDGAAWQPLGAGLDIGWDGVEALQASDVGLFAGGDFTAAGGVPASAVARWTGSVWEPLGDGLTGGPSTPIVRDFEIHGGYLYMVGTFHYAGGKISTHIARWSEAMTPVALAGFAATPEPGAVELRWRIEGDGIPELRLDAQLGDLNWEPSFVESTPGEYRCRDAAAPLAAGGEVVYRLSGREAGEEWTLLRRVSVTVAPLPTPERPSIAVWPNPGNPSFRVELSLPTAGKVRVAVMDIAGRRIATLHDGPMDAGERTLVWDGTDDEGRAQSSGVYLLDLRGSAGAAGRRLVLLR